MLSTRARHSGGAPDVTGQIAAVDTALGAGAQFLDPEAVAAARTVLVRAGERSRIGAETTAVALVGATGSGKSSLFNAISGLGIAEVGAKRPTTSEPLACIWGRDIEDPVLDFVRVPRRHRMERESVLDGDREVPLHGLVLLDVPDHDSTAVAHRLEVDRLVEVVDLMIWVVDPQKYADQALHARYLKNLTGYESVMLVVLNQIDRLADDEAELCRRDLRRLLDADGLESVRLMTASASRGDGIEPLRAVLGEVVHRKTVVAQRLSADLDDVMDRLALGVADKEPDVADAAREDRLVDALAAATGIPVVAEAAGEQYATLGRRTTGWPPARWVSRLLRRDPVRRLGLGADERELRKLARATAPAASPAQVSAVAAAVERVTAAASDGLPPRWADGVRAAVPVSVAEELTGTSTHDADAAEEGDGSLTGVLDDALAGVDLGSPRRGWFRVVQVVQWLALLGCLGGLGWAAADALDLGDVPNPAVAEGSPWDDVPLAAVPAVGGLVVGVLLALLARWWVGVGARRRRERVGDLLRAAVVEVAQERVVAPVAALVDRHRATREALSLRR